MVVYNTKMNFIGENNLQLIENCKTKNLLPPKKWVWLYSN